MAETVLKLTDFSKAYDGKPAVKHLSLSVEEGEIFGFIGHNGAGKSTTIKSIVGILSARDGGSIEVCGKSVLNKKKECQKLMAYIPDNPDLYEYLTGIGYINFVADIFEVPAEVRTERVKKYGDAFEITDALGELISSYSHGMRQKVALIAAFVHHPKLLVLDEPFVGLDPKATAVLKTAMREFCDDGCAVFFSTHILDVAERICDRVAMIDHGELVVTGRVDELTREKTLEEVFLENLETMGDTTSEVPYA